VLLAPPRSVKLQIGASTWQWQDLNELTDAITLKATNLTPSSSVYEQMYPHLVWFKNVWRNAKEAEGICRDFEDLFQSTQHFLASDPRDKLFALLHLSQNTRYLMGRDMGFVPNYERSLERTIFEFSRRGITLPLVVKLMPHASVKSGMTAQFGFWYADVTEMTVSLTLPLVSEQPYPLTGKLHCHIMESIGHIRDTWLHGAAEILRSLVICCRSLVPQVDDAEYFLNILTLAGVQHEDVISNRSKWLSFGKSLLSDVLSGLPEETDAHWNEQSKAFLTRWNQQFRPLNRRSHGIRLDRLEQSPFATPYHVEALPTLFRTSSGAILLSHDYIMPGDVVMILPDGGPFIVRRQNANEQRLVPGEEMYFMGACSIYPTTPL
jgi:hypothetical protein